MADVTDNINFFEQETGGKDVFGKNTTMTETENSITETYSYEKVVS